LLLSRYILLLGVAEAPTLVALDLLASEIAKRSVLIVGARIADYGKQVKHCIEGHITHSRCGTDGISLYEGGDNLAMLVFI
jgi:hypothetical protein